MMPAGRPGNLCETDRPGAAFAAPRASSTWCVVVRRRLLPVVGPYPGASSPKLGAAWLDRASGPDALGQCVGARWP